MTISNNQPLPQLGNISPQQFIDEYWQQKPLVIKNAIAHIDNLPDINTIAGLAVEDFIESRLIEQKGRKWKAMQGPLSEKTLQKLDTKNWTILVQGVNNWLAETKPLLELYSFLPDWLLDDIMVSISAPGGGVGPHVDQYDVFLVQGEGKRRWRVGLPNPNLQEVVRDETIKQVEQFESSIDVICEPGDVLYIPPLHPHEGITLETGSTYSIGFRAPNQQEFLERLLMVMEDHNLGKKYFNANFDLQQSRHQISTNIATQLKAFIDEICQDQALLLNTFGELATHLKSPLFEEPADAADKASHFGWNSMTRAVYSIDNQGKLTLFVNGEHFYLPAETEEIIENLCQKREIALNLIKNHPNAIEINQLLTILVDKGFGLFLSNYEKTSDC